MGSYVDITPAPASPMGDAFGRFRVSTPYTVLALKQLYDSNGLFYDIAEVSGSGTGSSYNTNKASTDLSVSANTAGLIAQQAKVRGTYQAGKSQSIFLTCAEFDTTQGLTKRVGYFDANNGLFFQSKDGKLGVVTRTYTSGAPVDTVVNQADWNSDKMDGTGPSGIRLDPSKANIYIIDFEWLGVGRVRFGVNINGVTYYVHQSMNANILAQVYMSTPNLPIRYDLQNDGTGAADQFMTICAAISSEGGQEDVAVPTYISRDGTPITLANQDLYTPIISIRLKSTHLGTRIKPIDVDAFASTATNFEWRLFLNPTIAGSDAVSWQDLANSSLQYDISRNNTNTLSGGYVLSGGYGSSSGATKIPVTGDTKSFLSLGAKIDGTLDEIVLGIANIDANGGTMYGGLTVGEYY